MCDLLSALHDTHNGSLCLVVAIRGHALVGLLVLGFGFLGLNLVDFDTVPGIRKAEVDREGVVSIDIFAFWRFTEDAETGAGEGLEGALQFIVIWLALAYSDTKGCWRFRLKYQDPRRLSAPHMTSFLLY